jgi:hypothetical protein
MADKFKLGKESGGLGIKWTDPTQQEFYVKVVMAGTNVKEMKEKGKKIPVDVRFGEPMSVGEISVAVRKARVSGTIGKTCLGIIPYETDQKINFNAPVTVL